MVASATVIAVVLGAGAAFALPTPFPGDATPDGVVAGYPAPVPAGCDVGGAALTGVSFTAGGQTATTLDGLDLEPGDVITMNWTGFKAGCEAVGVSLSAKEAPIPTFDPTANQALIPGWTYCGPAPGGSPCVATGGVYSLTVTVPALATACNYQIDAALGVPLAIVGPNGSYYQYNKPWNRLVSATNGGVGRTPCVEPTDFTITVDKVILGPGTGPFTFVVTDGGGATVETFSLPEADATPLTHTVEGLEAGDYTVTETVTGGAASVTPAASQSVTLSAADPTGAVTFTNLFTSVSATIACLPGDSGSIARVTMVNGGGAPTTFTVSATVSSEAGVGEIAPQTVPVAAGGAETVDLAFPSDAVLTAVVTSPASDDTNLLADPTVPGCGPAVNSYEVVPCQNDLPVVAVKVTSGAEPLDYSLTVGENPPRTGTVPGGETVELVVDVVPGVPVQVTLLLDGETAFDDEIPIDCTPVYSFTITCEEDGSTVSIGNDTSTPAVFEVTVDGEAFSTLNVGPGGEGAVFVPVPAGGTRFVEVTRNGVEIGSADATSGCTVEVRIACAEDGASIQITTGGNQGDTTFRVEQNGSLVGNVDVPNDSSGSIIAEQAEGELATYRVISDDDTYDSGDITYRRDCEELPDTGIELAPYLAASGALTGSGVGLVGLASVARRKRRPAHAKRR